jgi:glycosyltransferase involved in cell wall biosynthesis
LSNLPDLSGKTILQVIPELDAGGAERAVIDMADALRRAGARALVASRGGRLEADLRAAGGDLIEMDAASKNPVTLFQNAKKLERLIGEHTIDLVHARSRAPAWSALRATQKSATPFVTTYHGAYSGNGFWPKKLYNSVMARGDLVIANSGWTGAHVRDVHKIGNDQIIVIPRGIDFEQFDAEKVSPERIASQRQIWGLASENTRTVLLLPARLTDWKGQRLALKALSGLAPEERTGLVLVMVGDAQGRQSYVQKIEQDIAAFGLLECTRLAGHCTDMPAALLAADIVLAPSLKPEAFGRTAAEAAAMGRPVIAADHGGARETVIEGESGARFDPGNANALTGAIRSLLSIGAVARNGMGQSGRRHVLQHFSRRGLQAATLSVYSALIAKGKPVEE